MNTTKVRTNPRFSVNALATYMTATPTQRAQLIADQKRPGFGGPYYREANKVISTHLAAGMPDDRALQAAYLRLSRAHKDEKEKETKRRADNAIAIQRFQEMRSEIDLLGLTPRHSSTKMEKLTLSGVSISVWPEILLSGEVKRRGFVCGGIKLAISRNATEAFERGSGDYPACLVQRLLQGHAAEGTSVYGKACMTIDVFGQCVRPAPASYKTRMKNLLAACDEIRLGWGRC